MMACMTIGGLIVLILLAAAAPAHAQGNNLAQSMYVTMENSIRGEYESLLAGLSREGTEKIRELLKVLTYNKAAILAACAEEGDSGRSPGTRVPSSMNLMLNTCLEVRITQLNKFSQTLGYAEIFFPDRIASCGEQSRLRELEKILPPYDFLFLDEPKLYDLGHYNECLMKR
jgi:hypothetical protein